MATVRSLSRSFAGGEITPELYGRLDLAKFQTGLALCRNFVTLPHGPAMNRPGFEFIRATKDSAVASRLVPFSYSNAQTFAIEMGAGYFRFHTSGATLLAGSPAAYNGATAYTPGNLVSSGGVNYYCIAATTGNAPPNASYWYALPATGEYEIPNPYAAADLFDIHFVQSADVLTLVHPSYAPRELRRYGATDWRLATISFGAPTNAPTGVTGAATVGTGSDSFQYVVTTVNTDNLEESVASSASSAITNDLSIAGNYNTITWSAASGAIRYNVYKLSNGLYGYIGQAGGLSFKDDNIIADISQTPPINETVFAGAGEYPGAVSYYEQRRWFAGSTNKPQNMWGTRSGTESNMAYSIPVRSDDRIAFRIAAREASRIQHIVPVANMLLLTPSGEWRVSPNGSDAITPASISVRPQSYNGANNVTPAVIGNSVLFAQSRGGRIREMSYSWQANGYLSNDISILAPHLFDFYDTVDLAFIRAVHPILWCVRSDGKLLGLTYVAEQQVAAWHQHDTDGYFESVCSVAEEDEDMLYAIVRRTINGSTKRYVERLHTRNFQAQEDAFFVDCGLTYDGTPATAISGLSHLEGKTVNILADGAVVEPQVVTSGAITLPEAASVVHVGLPITADLQTLPLAAQIDGAFAQGRPKNVNAVWLRVNRSSGIKAGPAFDKLTDYKQRTTESYGSPPALVSDEIKISVSPSWGSSGQVCVRQSDPLPLTVASMTIEAAVGG
jgi:hypothetical protein